MSFEKLKQSELHEAVVKASEFYGFQAPPEDATKKDMLALLGEEGVTWPSYQKFLVPDEEPVVEEKEVDQPLMGAEFPPSDPEDADGVLLRMTRENFTFTVLGHKFTQAHPFAIVSKDDANIIMDRYEGFRPASPREADQYYG